MLEKEFHISKLIAGHLKGELSPEQQAELNTWVTSSAENQRLLDEFYHEQINADIKHYQSANKDAVWNKAINRLNAEPVNKQYLKFAFRQRIAAAAAILLLMFGAGLYFYTNLKKDTTSERYTNDVTPGSNYKATLTLSNGRKIILSDAGKGELAKESGMRISKTAEGQLIYEIAPEAAPSLSGNTKPALNTISTAKGETFQVRLPDGSQIYLNAASSLKYPASFAKLKERRVELSGEAYFIIKHDARQPFRVITKGQVVEDMGTEFNINAYENEALVKTALVEGSARVLSNSAKHQNGVVLTPGLQSNLDNEGLIKVNNANLKEVTAWKNGYFRFSEENLESIMRQISRWYNVEVVYEGGNVIFKDLTFWGFVSRTKNISEVLKIIERTGKVQFNIKGRTITVSKI